MINKPQKFMETAIEIFCRQSKIANKPSDPFTMGFDPSGFYTRGHCAEFAYVLADFASQKGLNPQITIMFSNIISDKSNELIEKRLSHCIVELDGESYDICGNDARMSWFIKAGYIDQDATGMRREWEFACISMEDKKEAFSQLKEHCNKHDVPFSLEQIEKDKGIFNSLSNRSKNREEHLHI